MNGAVPMVELWRGDLLESRHLGHAAIWHDDGGLVESWGDPQATIYPRSSCKMLQALPLLESGAGAALGSESLALACASHQGSAEHVRGVTRWLADLHLGESDLRCGAHEPDDRAERERLVRAADRPCQIHNNCSGKHTGFLMLNQHLKGGPDYVHPEHPVQQAVRVAFEEVTGQTSPGFGIDGCSAPNFATSLSALARAMARFAGASGLGDSREKSMHRLIEAMVTHPDLVAGERRACTELMRAMEPPTAIKTGAEGVFVAILPQKRMGIALKIADGATRAAEAAIVALLARVGALDPAHPAALKRLGGPIRNWRKIEIGQMRLAPGFCAETNL